MPEAGYALTLLAAPSLRPSGAGLVATVRDAAKLLWSIPQAIRVIRRVRPDVIFSTVVGSGTSTLYRAHRAAGFDPTRMPIASLTTSEAEVARAMAGQAAHTIILADYSKIGQRSRVSFCAVERIHQLITDKRARALPALAALQDAGCNVVIA